MCGRFTRYLTWAEIQRLYRLTTDWERQRNDEPGYNIAPTETVPFVTAGEKGAHKLREGPLVACSVVGERNPQAGDVQRPHRDRRYIQRLQGCLSRDPLPDPG